MGEIGVFIKSALEAAKKYPEGRGIGFDVKYKNLIPDIEMVIDVKLAKQFESTL